VRDASHGYPDSARRQAALALSLPAEKRRAELCSSGICGGWGRRKSSEAHRRSGKEFRATRSFINFFNPSCRLFNLLQQNKPTETIAALEPLTKYELGSGPGIPALWPIYVRGQAFLRLKDGGKRRGEFQKILDHRGVAPLSETASPRTAQSRACPRPSARRSKARLATRISCLVEKMPILMFLFSVLQRPNTPSCHDRRLRCDERRRRDSFLKSSRDNFNSVWQRNAASSARKSTISLFKLAPGATLFSI